MGETFSIPSTSPASFPSVLHPEGLRFLGAPPGQLAHQWNSTAFDLRKQEIRISRNAGIWIIKRIFFSAADLSSREPRLSWSSPWLPAHRSRNSLTTCQKAIAVRRKPRNVQTTLFSRTSSRLPAVRGGRGGSRRRATASCPEAGGQAGGRRQPRRRRSRRQCGLRPRCRAGPG